jgi:hypothetical protein
MLPVLATWYLRTSLLGYLDPHGFAYCWVHSWAVLIACAWFSFHACATSFARGSSGLGAPKRAWIERRMVRIWSAGDQLPEIISQLEDAQSKISHTLEDVEADAP